MSNYLAHNLSCCVPYFLTKSHQERKSAKLCWMSWLQKQLHPVRWRIKHAEDNSDRKIKPNLVIQKPLCSLSTLSSLPLHSLVRVSAGVKLPASVFMPAKSSKESTTATHRAKTPQGIMSFSREGMDTPFTSLNQFFLSAERNQAPLSLHSVVFQCHEKIPMDSWKRGVSSLCIWQLCVRG